MSKIKALAIFTLGFLSAFLLFGWYERMEEEPEMEVIQRDYVTPEYSPFSGVISISQPKMGKIPVLQKAEIQTVEVQEPKLVNIGEFRITYYCNCEQCCGEWAQYHTTFTGTTPTENHTVAVDPSIIPLGTILEINGETYIAEDTGAFQGRIIDIYVPDHNRGYELAAQNGDYAEVYIKEDM